MPIDFNFPGKIHGLIMTISPLDFLDIIIVAITLYKVYSMIRDTKAITLFKGVMTIVTLTAVCEWSELHVTSWLLGKSTNWLLVALPILFQPELRRALEHLGRGKFLNKEIFLLDKTEANFIVNEITKAIKKLSQTKTGALIVLEQKTKLNDVISSGIFIDGIISSELLLNIFIVNTPLHDGAVIIRGRRISAAACILPLTSSNNLSTELGTRHRAAIGLSEQSDAIIIVVSEETGIISIAENGHIIRNLDRKTLANKIRPAFVKPKKASFDNLLSAWRSKE